MSRLLILIGITAVFEGTSGMLDLAPTLDTSDKRRESTLLHELRDSDALCNLLQINGGGR